MDRETIVWAVVIVIYVCMVAFVLTGGRVIQGEAVVIDGDTIKISDESVRLYGIDAPEAEQTCLRNGQTWKCGIEAARALHGLINNQPVACRTKGEDGFNRPLAVCRAQGAELNAAMVEMGMALAFREYSLAYIRHEERAEKASRGLWAGHFVKPWIFRRGCLIKGNINSKGRKIYHVPGSTPYAATQINEAAGERWFCTKEEALAAGWAPARTGS